MSYLNCSSEILFCAATFIFSFVCNSSFSVRQDIPSNTEVFVLFVKVVVPFKKNQVDANPWYVLKLNVESVPQDSKILEHALKALLKYQS